eukprot:TRINITY_DN57735_c0_g1_i1.p1 TRINITY_DN57735_c0_g1~~TRINITY_DN57735_c0_g1_i1.p1  ORF type:complete len:908 (-),score=212.48 TRINITY_DN57735_c0_g1_i1:454-3177(-)
MTSRAMSSCGGGRPPGSRHKALPKVYGGSASRSTEPPDAATPALCQAAAATYSALLQSPWRKKAPGQAGFAGSPMPQLAYTPRVPLQCDSSRFESDGLGERVPADFVDLRQVPELAPHSAPATIGRPGTAGSLDLVHPALGLGALRMPFKPPGCLGLVAMRGHRQQSGGSSPSKPRPASQGRPVGGFAFADANSLLLTGADSVAMDSFSRPWSVSSYQKQVVSLPLDDSCKPGLPPPTPDLFTLSDLMEKDFPFLSPVSPTRSDVNGLLPSSPSTTSRDRSTANVAMASLSPGLQGAIQDLQSLHRPWNPQLFLQAKKDFTKDGKQGCVKELVACVRSSTELAIKRGHYYAAAATGGRPAKVDISDHTHVSGIVKWFGTMNVDRHLLRQGGESGHKAYVPPLLLCDRSPSDVAARVQEQHGRAPVLVVEVSDFGEGGSFRIDRLVGMNPACLLLRSNFSSFLAVAANQLKPGKATPKSHLCAQHDPYVILCKDVLVFRGSRSEGYPFLSKPFTLDVLVYAQEKQRPKIQFRTAEGVQKEWYMDQREHYRMTERLTLIGGALLQEYCSEGGSLPHLVMALPGTGGDAELPRDAVVSAIKQWSKRFAPCFHSVFLCSAGREGSIRDSEMASHIAEHVNRHVDKILISNNAANKAAGWHWTEWQLRLTCQEDKLMMAAHAVARHLQGVELGEPQVELTGSALSKYKQERKIKADLARSTDARAHSKERHDGDGAMEGEVQRLKARSVLSVHSRESNEEEEDDGPPTSPGGSMFVEITKVATNACLTMEERAKKINAKRNVANLLGNYVEDNARERPEDGAGKLISGLKSQMVDQESSARVRQRIRRKTQKLTQKNLQGLAEAAAAAAERDAAEEGEEGGRVERTSSSATDASAMDREPTDVTDASGSCQP